MEKRFMFFVCGYFLDKIEKVEIVKETEKTYSIKEKSFYNDGSFRERRVNDKSNFFPTWEEAHSRIVELQRERVKYSEDRLENEKADLEKMLAMKNPEGEA